MLNRLDPFFSYCFGPHSITLTVLCFCIMSLTFIKGRFNIPIKIVTICALSTICTTVVGTVQFHPKMPLLQIYAEEIAVLCREEWKPGAISLLCLRHSELCYDLCLPFVL